MKTNKDNKPLIFGIIGGLIASLCCLGPVILVLFGLSGVSFALSIGKYTSVFLSIAIIFLVIALILYYKSNKSCNIEGFKKNWKQILIAFIVLAVILIVVKYGLSTYLAKLAYG